MGKMGCEEFRVENVTESGIALAVAAAAAAVAEQMIVVIQVKETGSPTLEVQRTSSGCVGKVTSLRRSQEYPSTSS